MKHKKRIENFDDNIASHKPSCRAQGYPRQSSTFGFVMFILYPYLIRLVWKLNSGVRVPWALRSPFFPS